MMKKQKGATLIVVLILLVAITIMGVYAIRQSMVSLGVATNSQVQQLVMQNSDAAFYQVSDVSNLALNLSKAGVFGQNDTKSDRNKEVVFCYRSDKADFFDPETYSVISWENGNSAPTNNSNGTGGYCQISALDSVANFFTSGRKAVMTQVAIKYTSDSQGEKFENVPEAIDPEKAKVIPPQKMNVYSISIMPSLAKASSASINTCLSSRMSEVTPPENLRNNIPMPAGQSITECLTELNVPFTSQVSEYLIEQTFID